MTGKRRYWGLLFPSDAATMTQVAHGCEAAGLEGIWAVQLYGPPFLPLAAAAMVTKRIKPMTIAGKKVYQIGMPIHWGFFGAGEQKGSIANLVTVEPQEGATPAGRTIVGVLADENEIVIGARCFDADPKGIVSFSKAKDSELAEEDHLVFVLDTFLDSRSGYVFAVNPSGARFDGLVVANGEDVNSEWDAVWEAKTSRDSTGWSAEIRIPIKSLGFKPDLTTWGFNVERRVQRLQETSRWSGINIDYVIYKTENFVTVFEELSAADEATAAFDGAVLAMNAGDAAAERKQLAKARTALERANRLVREAAQQMIPYAGIPTERHILYLFNDAIPSHEAAQHYLFEVIALRTRRGR